VGASAAGLGQQHQGRQPHDLAVGGHQTTHQAGQSDGLGDQVVAYGIRLGAALRAEVTACVEFERSQLVERPDGSGGDQQVACHADPQVTDEFDRHDESSQHNEPTERTIQ
jgi:hypothetical protein